MSGQPFLTTSETTWQEIQQYFNDEGSKLNIKKLFTEDAGRFDKFK